MPLGGSAAGSSTVRQGNAYRLIVILQHMLIPLHHVDRPQFHMLALKLDRALHFGTGIAPSHIADTPLHAPDWFRFPNPAHELDGIFGKPKMADPGLKLLCCQHWSARLSITLDVSFSVPKRGLPEKSIPKNR